MTANILSLNVDHSQPLKRSTIQVNNTSDSELLSDSKISHIINEITEQVDKQNIKTKKLTKTNINEQSYIDNNDSKIEPSLIDLNLVKHSESPVVDSNNKTVNKTQNSTQHSIIRVKKLKDLCVTPTKNVTFGDLEDIKNIKEENIGSPQIFSPTALNTNSSDWIMNNIKVLQETPVSHKRKGKHILDNNETPTRTKKRKVSCDISDCKQFSNVLNMVFCDDELSNMESINMLHELSSVMDFEECKVATDFFCSTANNTMQTEQNMEEVKNAEIDPLFISDAEDNMTLKNVENYDRDVKFSPKGQDRNKSSNTTNGKSNIVNDNDENADYDLIKDILGDLDIDLNSDKNETYEQCEDALERLYDLEIKLTHEIPEQHKIEHTAGSKTLTKLEKKLFLKHGPLKSGPFTPNEDKIIMNNWEAFCKAHDWNPKFVKPFLKMKNGNKFFIKSMQERKKFTQFLANRLPWRTLYSVYHRFKYLFGSHKKIFRRYSSAEDNSILSYINKQKKAKKHKFVALSKMLGRSNHSIWLRYQLLKKMQQLEEKPPSFKWTPALIGKFIKTLMNITLCESVTELKDAIIPKVVWQKLQEKLNIDYNTLRTFWIHQLHMQLFCPEPIYLNDIKIKLIEYVYGKGIADTREIVWSDVAKYFEGVTSIFLCRTFLYLVQDVSAKICTKSFPDIIEYLYNKKIIDITNDSTDKFLPRLSYDNEKVKIIDKDLNEYIDTS